jgi:hypothetical protein
LQATDNDIDKGRIGLNNYNTHTHFDDVNVVSISPLSSPFDIDTSSWLEGQHKVDIFAVDIVGNQNNVSYLFTIDNTPPRVENSTINKTISQGENATIIVNVWDNVELDKVIVEENQTTNYTMQKVIGNNYTVTIPYPNLGNHSIRYFANDTAGNVNDTVYDWFNVIEAFKPNVVSVKITPSKVFDLSYVKSGNITFNITFDMDMNTSIPLSVTYGNVAPYSNFTVIGNWIGATKEWTGYSVINTTTPNGNYTLNISRGTNLAGKVMDDNTSTQFVIDTTSPIVTSVVMSDPSPTKAGNVTFDISFSENMDTTVPLNVSFGLASPYTQRVVIGNWTNSTLWSGYYVINSATGDGWNTVRIAGGQDLAGNVMVANTSNTFLIDTIAPVVRNATIPNIIYTTQNLTIMVEAFDIGILGKIDKAVIQINNTTSSENYSMSIAYSGLVSERPYGWINKTTYYVIIPNTSLSMGSYSVRFYVNDTANNVNDSVTGSFFVNDTMKSIGGSIAFLCRNDPVWDESTGDLSCNYGIENQTVKWLREQGWKVIVKRYNVWTEADLNSTDLIVCSDQTYACNPAVNSPVWKQHKIYGKGFVEIPTTISATAGYRFGYLSTKSGLLSPRNTNLSIETADMITSGYPISTPIFTSPQTIGGVMDRNLKSNSIDLANPGTYRFASSLFKVDQTGTQGRYIYVGWFYGISYSYTIPFFNRTIYWFYGWTPYNLNSNGKELLIRSLNWAQCGNIVGCA